MHRLDDLSLDAKRAVAAALVAERARRRSSFPLSSAQLRLWLIDRNVGGDPIYNVSRAFVLEGTLDIGALERSVGEIVRRHAIFRTTYHATDGDPVQVVNPWQPFVFVRSELRDIPADRADVAVDALVATEAGYRFALDRDPMLRGRLVQLAADRHVVIFTMHHLAIDAWSFEIVYRELQTCYAAEVAGVTPLLAPPAMSYGEYALRERAQNASERVASQLDYWKAQLADAPEIVLPVSGPRPAFPSVAGAVDGVRLSGAGVAALADLARRTGATPFMTYVAAFAVVIHSVSSQTDFVIGSPISGRRGADTEGLVGFFANALALRVDLSGDPTFAECLARTKRVSLGAFDNRDVPFEHVVTSVTSRRVAGANPLFDVAFAMQGRSDTQLRLANLTITARPHSHDTAKFDLLALLCESDSGFDFQLHYRTERFAATAIAVMLGRMREIVDRASAHPDRPLSQLTARLTPIANDTRRATPPQLLPLLSAADLRPADPLTGAQRDRLRPIFAELLDVGTVDDEADFFALGGHSLLAVRLVARVEAMLGVRLSMASFIARPTVAGLAEAVGAGMRRPAVSALEVVRRGSADVPIVIFHGDYTGGGSYLRALAGELGDRTIYALPPHGADGGPVPESIEAMAAERLALLTREGVRAPFDVVGYCNGAAVALEVARAVAASGVPPPRVFAIGSEPYEPAIVRCAALVRFCVAPFALGARMQAKLVLRLLRWKRRIRAAGPLALIAIAREEARWRRNAWRRAKRVGSATIGVADPSLLDTYSERLISYRPAAYAGPIVVFRPVTGERGTTRDDRRAGWARVNESTRIELVPGDHQSAITTFGRPLAHRLRGYLDR